MTDFAFPEGITPFEVDFYLQSHSGGSESPFSRSTKTYVLSGARWVCRMRFRTAWDEASDQMDGSPIPEWQGKLSAFLDRLQGRTHRALLWDVRREQDGSTLTNETISRGDTAVTVSGGTPKVGGYIGGDGRPHRIVAVTSAGGDTYQCEVIPAFRDDVPAGEAEFERVTGRFMLTGDDAAASASGAGQPAIYELEFVEDLNYFHPASLFGADDDGYLFDFSNPATVYKSASLLVPVEADEDAVGFARDLSGNDNHGGQSTLANRPLWKEAPNGLKGLYFDGTDHILYLSQSVFTSAGCTVVMCAQVEALNNSGAAQVLWAEVGESTEALYYMSTATGRSLAQDDDAVAKLRLGFENDAGTTGTMDSDEAFADDNPRILTMRDEAATLGSFIDNREEASTLARSGSFTITNQAIGALDGVGANPVSSYMQGWIFGLFAINRPLTDAEVAWVQAWFAERYYVPMRQADGVHTIPVVPRVTMFHGHRLIGSLTKSAGIRITDMEWDGHFRGRAYSPWSMGAVAGDAHSAPALLPMSDGRLATSWTGHNAQCWVRVTTGASIAPGGWEDTRNIIGSTNELGLANRCTYSSLQEMATGTYLFVRGRLSSETDAERGYWYSRADDPADEFETATKFIAGTGDEGPYVVGFPTSPYRRDFQISTGNPSSTAVNSMYHCYMAIDPDDGAVTFHQTDGTPITLPMDPDDATLVYDGTTDRAWIVDMVVGPDGTPCMVYVVFNDYPTEDDYTYHYARWNGSAWISAPIADGGDGIIPGNAIGNGGAAIDPEDPNVVIASCLPDGGSVLQAFRFTTADNGLTWTGEQITDDEQQVWGPSFIHGAPEPRLVLTVGPFQDDGGIFVGDTRLRMANSVTGAWE